MTILSSLAPDLHYLRAARRQGPRLSPNTCVADRLCVTPTLLCHRRINRWITATKIVGHCIVLYLQVYLKIYNYSAISRFFLIYNQLNKMLPLHHFSARIGRNQRGILSHWKPSQNRVLLACLSNSSTGVAAVSSNYSDESSDGSRKLYAALVSASGVLVTLGWTWHSQSNTRNITQLESALATDDKTTTLLNWSGTHEVVVEDSHYWEPDSIAEVELIVDKCHQEGKPLRPLGSALSPNGIAFRSGGMISMSNLDQIVDVDVQNKTVTAQAGARVSQVVDALRAHDLTLPNLASIAEQQMGGFVQVGAHGTGKAIAPVDHYVTKLKLVTPAKGTIELTEEDGELFHLAKVGLGCLGVVVEVTMQCIPAHKLVEHTFVLTRKEAKEQLDTLLKKHKHVRYMWIPYEDAVVVVTNDPEDKVPDYILRQFSKVHDPKEKFKPLTDLLLQLSKEYEDLPTAKVYTEETIEGMGFGELRDALLAFSPLNMDHVKRVNKAEAQFWHNNEGYQTKPSDQLLQFDCGGQVRVVLLFFFFVILFYSFILSKVE